VATLTIIYWRDIPAQVVAEEGRGPSREQVKAELPRRFSLAIDEAAMRGGAEDTDEYLAGWRKSKPEKIDGDFRTAADARAAELDKEFNEDILAALVANGGKSA
jgi:hypothetical protein